MDNLDELWVTILGAILIMAVGAFLLFKIRYGNQSNENPSNVDSKPLEIPKMPEFKSLPRISRYINGRRRKSVLYGAFALSVASAMLFAGNYMGNNSGPASADTDTNASTAQAKAAIETLPEQVMVEASSSSIIGKESSVVPLKLKITNNGNAIIQDVHFEGQSESTSISPKSTTMLIINTAVKGFTAHKNMNITLFYTSNGNKYSKSVQTPIYPVPNAAIKDLEYKREAHNFIIADQFEPGENATLRFTVVNRGASKLPSSSIKILGFMDDSEAAPNVSKDVDVGLNQNGEYLYEITFRISENPPYGETNANVALLYNDTQKGDLILDQRSLPVKIIARNTFKF